MIYALITTDISDHERRIIARKIRDDQSDFGCLAEKVIHVRDTKVGKGHHRCIYCFKRVFKWYRNDTVLFQHEPLEGEKCLGTDNGLTGIINPHGVTIRKS